MKANNLLRKTSLSLMIVYSIGLTGCSKPADAAAHNANSNTSPAETAPPAIVPAAQQASAAPANSRVINASLKSFSCGADACYLTYGTDDGKEARAICDNDQFCSAWSLVDRGEDGLDKIKLIQGHGVRFKLTLISALFEPAGENMDFVHKIEFLQE
jgi:hypothetical protein